MEMSRNYRSQPHRVEMPDKVQLITSKCAQNRLWFVNNPAFEEYIHAYLAKYVEAFGVELIHFEIVGNHFHLEARFPHSNTAKFMQHFNARIAQGAKQLVKGYRGGNRFFGRRYTAQYLPTSADVIKCFFYVALQCVSSKLAPSLGEYPKKTLTADAIKQIDRTYRYFEYGRYNADVRRGKQGSRKDYWKYYTLRFSRVLGHEDLPQKEYEALMFRLLEVHRQELLKRMKPEKFLGAEALKKVVPGSLPHNSKTGTRRPIVLTVCREAKKEVLELYFSYCEKFKKASSSFRRGKLDVVFPKGMYLPPGSTVFAA